MNLDDLLPTVLGLVGSAGQQRCAACGDAPRNGTMLKLLANHASRNHESSDHLTFDLSRIRIDEDAMDAAAADVAHFLEVLRTHPDAIAKAFRYAQHGLITPAAAVLADAGFSEEALRKRHGHWIGIVIVAVVLVLAYPTEIASEGEREVEVPDETVSELEQHGYLRRD